MSYSRHTWSKGEVIDADKLNNIEDGINALNGLDNVDVEFSYNLFGRTPITQSMTGMPSVEDVEHGYKVTYNTTLTTGACYLRLKFHDDASDFIGSKLTISFDAVCGEGNNAGANQRVALYVNGKKLLKSSTFNTSGHYYATTNAIDDSSTGKIEVFIYPDASNSNRSNPNTVTITNIVVSVGTSDMPYAPAYTAIDYTARAQIAELQAAVVELASVIGG